MLNVKASTRFHCFCFQQSSTPEIYTLSLHDALPICVPGTTRSIPIRRPRPRTSETMGSSASQRFISADRKSTRLNSSHTVISYAVFCLKKKTQSIKKTTYNKPNTRIQSDVLQQP